MFVTMGAGIVGSSIAYHHPTEAGCRDVLIIERKTRQGLGSTGKSMGAWVPSSRPERFARYQLQNH